jgi:hypothetical protein
MKRLTISSVVIVEGLTGCARAGNIDQKSGTGSNWAEVLVLLLAAAVLYLAFSGLAARLLHRKPRSEVSFDLESRRVWSRPKRTHGRRGHGPDRHGDRSASASDSVSQLPAQSEGPGGIG